MENYHLVMKDNLEFYSKRVFYFANLIGSMHFHLSNFLNVQTRNLS